MKSLIQAVAVAAALIVPVASFAQQANAPLTRAQVRAELVELEQAGYRPGDSDNTHYPDGIQAAEARVAASKAASAYGGVAAGSSGSGQRVVTHPAVSKDDWWSMYGRS